MICTLHSNSKRVHSLLPYLVPNWLRLWATGRDPLTVKFNHKRNPDIKQHITLHYWLGLRKSPNDASLIKNTLYLAHLYFRVMATPNNLFPIGSQVVKEFQPDFRLLKKKRAELTISLWLAEENGAGAGMIWGIVLHGKIWRQRKENMSLKEKQGLNWRLDSVGLMPECRSMKLWCAKRKKKQLLSGKTAFIVLLAKLYLTFYNHQVDRNHWDWGDRSFHLEASGVNHLLSNGLNWWENNLPASSVLHQRRVNGGL